MPDRASPINPKVRVVTSRTPSHAERESRRIRVRPHSATPAKTGEATEANRRRAAARTTSDPYKDLKRVVHARLVSSLGPTLYDAHMTQSDLEQQVRLALQGFALDAHRIEVVASVGEITWVDDSKATNPHAANASLASYPSVVWVVGGLLKGVQIDEIVRRHADRVTVATAAPRGNRTTHRRSPAGGLRRGFAWWAGRCQAWDGPKPAWRAESSS